MERFLTPVEPPPIPALSAKQWSVTHLANNRLHLTSVLAETPGTSETMLCNLLPWNWASERSLPKTAQRGLCRRVTLFWRMLQRSYCLLEMPAPRNALQAPCCSFCIRRSIACPALMKRGGLRCCCCWLSQARAAHRSGPRHGLFAVTLPQSLYLEKIPHRLPMPRAVVAVQNIAHLLPGVVHRSQSP